MEVTKPARLYCQTICFVRGSTSMIRPRPASAIKMLPLGSGMASVGYFKAVPSARVWIFQAIRLSSDTLKTLAAR